MSGGRSIAAIATARGEAALAIVRVSGPDAVSIADSIFRGRLLRDAPSHSAAFGRVVDESGAVLDQAVALVFRAPSSSTGEDVVEFTCHGGDAAPSAVLEALLDAGAVPAAPGEFTRRAFLNGKLDLDQAESVIDLIHAQSTAAHRVSVRQLQGRLKRRLSSLRADLLRVCGLVELELDFGEEDVEFADRADVSRLLADSLNTLREMLGSAELTAKWRDGLSVVLVGRPNAGKSTLLNAMVGADRVIVSSTPGTTRDFVEVALDLDGLLLRLVDTAGLRVTDDEIEAEGVRRTEALTAQADVVIYVADSKEALSDVEKSFIADQISQKGSKQVVLVANKADLLTDGLEPDFGLFTSRTEDSASSGVNSRNSDLGWVSLSSTVALDRPEELKALLERLRLAIPQSLRSFDSSDGMINERHRRHLEEAVDAVRRSEELVASGSGGELLSLELRGALDAVGSITGEITNEDVLSEIFSRFCIGK